MDSLRQATTSSSILGLGALALMGIVCINIYQNNGDQNKPKQPETFASHVCEHDGNGLVELSEGVLWHVTAKFKGNGPPWRRMIVYRPPKTSSIILLSPTAVPEDVMSEIDKLGSVDVLIVPNSYHRTDSAVFKARYPKAKVACPPCWVKEAISEMVEVDMDARELAELYKDCIKVIRIGGLCNPKDSEGDFEYAYEFKCKDGSWAYAVTDCLFNMTDEGFMTKLFGSGGLKQSDGCFTPKVGRFGKFFMHSKKLCAEYYREYSKREDISMILMAHGDVFVGDTRKAFEDIANDVMP